MCHNDATWYQSLPTILLGLRTTIHEDLKATSAELVFGEIENLAIFYMTRIFICCYTFFYFSLSSEWIKAILDLGLRRHFSWRFVIADVPLPIIGLDFLAHHGLLPDCKHKLLLDGITSLSVRGQSTGHSMLSIKIISGEFTPYDHILKEYPILTRPAGTLRNVSHSTVHPIRTIPGPPVFCRPRRLAPERRKIAKAEFEAMVLEGTVRRGKGPWASPLHLVSKKSEDHKLITYAFLQRREKLPPVQLNQLSFIGQLTTDIQHISGADNVVSDAFSRISYIAPPPVDFKAIAEAQKEDTELLDLQTSDNTLKLKKIEVPGSDVTLVCDTSMPRPRPFVPASE
ncbi:uncharacterized protein TNIN_164111 [Trichonephila inaurata madagascariensis]|uniref:Uncharacterized protein n=1 Tax=Trichonephila inaurata madagascariensis TaxID=2747483 RepID=A0A8X6YAD8_9ARAC|nr:uncharacterized protein TNIN_164111 [Trichonephila inaurata madagascariensis]